ncbi:hypothetical protein [Leisingera sp. JC11]|uniref:hypothetical protein n=1 Tax=Leisingera sp. JC11 TaxID=3042469 RepID=UPI0034523B5A
MIAYQLQLPGSFHHQASAADFAKDSRSKFQFLAGSAFSDSNFISATARHALLDFLHSKKFTQGRAEACQLLMAPQLVQLPER